MKELRYYFVCVLLFALAFAGVLEGAPVDLSPPKNALGSAEGDGYLRYVHRFGDIRFSDNFSIPLRFDFSSRRIVEGAKSEFGWHGWNCGAIEATAVVREDGNLEVQLLCAKIMYLRPVKDQDGAFLTPDGSWKGTLAEGKVSIEREDGWALRFLDGKVESLRTDKGREIRWNRDEAGRLISIHEEGTVSPQLELSWSDDGAAREVVLGNQSYQFKFENQLLAAVEWTMGSGQRRSVDLDQKENTLHIETSKLTQFRFVWSAKTGILLGDGESSYTLQEIGSPGQPVARRILSMTTPDGTVVAHELGNRSGETRVTGPDGREVVITRVVSDNAANGAVDKMEWMRDGHPPLVLMKNVFDDEGKIIERFWLGETSKRKGYDGGTIDSALLPDRETVFPVDEIDPEAALTMQRYTYTDIGQLQLVTSNDSDVLRFAYDGENRLIKMSVTDRFEKSFEYGNDGTVVEALILPEQEKGSFWYLETESAGVGPDLVLSTKTDSDGRLLSQRFADGRTLMIEYDKAMRRVGDLIVAPDGRTEIERVTYVHSPQEETALRIRENFITGRIDHADVAIHAIGSGKDGRRIPKEVAVRRSAPTDRE